MGSSEGTETEVCVCLEACQVLGRKDTSWEATESAIGRIKTKMHKYGRLSAATTSQGVEEVQQAQISYAMSNILTDETPLILATKSGIIEIVKEILKQYPQAVEHIDNKGRNILHVAVKYRQMHIFDHVEKMEIPMKWLMRKIDNNGNSKLHMVGMKERAAKDMRSPAPLLQDDLLLFERVQKISSTHFTKHFNSKGQTAEELFASTNDKLRMDAEEWLKGTAQHCSIVAVLIATVAFAAAYSVPGGPSGSTGYPLLLNQPFFVIFSLTFALTSVITFLSILTSPFRLKDFKQSLPQKLMLGVTLLIFSISMMMMSFAATIILTIRNNQQWTRVALYSNAFLPVTIFALSYLPLYTSLMKSFIYSLELISSVFPRFNIKFRPAKLIESQVRNSTSSTYHSATQTTHSYV